MAALRPAPMLILDFDETLVDADSSEWVAELLGAASLFDELRWVRGMHWHHAMNVVLQTLHSQGVSIAHIRQAASALPLPPQTVSTLKAAHALGCELRIISDANTFFIEAALAHHGLDAIFTEIHSNPAWIDAMGCLHYDDFHGQALPPHTCPLCPLNMCKGSILEGIRAAALGSATLQVIYAGDGAGDLCPSLRLSARDYVLAREGYPLSKLLNQHQVKARVHPWTILADTLHDIVLKCVTSSNAYDLQPNSDPVSSSLLLSAIKTKAVKGSNAVAYNGCHRTGSHCEFRKNHLSHRRRAFVTCQSWSPKRSLHIHIVPKMHAFLRSRTPAFCKGASAVNMYQTGFCSTGRACQAYCGFSVG
ncbi:hypothetical protein L7F22_048928 [Adiantum nelumboides]|nr:hypothetical protein [Adiantum nelumboides]